MNQPSSPESLTPSDKEESKPHRNRTGTVIVIVMAIAIVAVPLIFFALPVEIAQWHIASAWRSLQASDTEAMIASLEKAQQWAPNEESVYMSRAEILLQAKQYEASLEAIDRALEVSPESILARLRRGQIFMQMERFADTVEEYEKLLDTEVGSSPMVLNGLAYARALADEEIDKGLNEIDEALAAFEEPDAALLDTRGFLYYRKGMLEEALADLDRAVAMTNLREASHQARTLSKLAPNYDAKAELTLTLTNLAVMRYHRGLVYEAMNQPEQAKRDFDKVREMGFDPQPGLF